MHNWDLHSWASLLIVTFEFPAIHNTRNPNTAMFVALYYARASPAAKDAPLPQIALSKDLDFAPYLARALNAYFRYVNTAISLFTTATFGLRRRCQLLMAAVWASGLVFLEQDAAFLRLQGHLHRQLQLGLKTNYSRVLFEELQVLMVTLHGLGHSRWSKKATWMGANLTLNVAYALGLHHTCLTGCCVVLYKRQVVQSLF